MREEPSNERNHLMKNLRKFSFPQSRRLFIAFLRRIITIRVAKRNFASRTRGTRGARIIIK